MSGTRGQPGRLRPLDEIPAAAARALTGILFDIDDTITRHGRLVPEAFAAIAVATVTCSAL